MVRRIALAATALAVLFSTQALAAEFTVRGVGSAPIVKGAKPEQIRALATHEAKRRAVIAAVDQMLGADASARPEVAQKIDQIVEQVSDASFSDVSSQAVGDHFEVSLSLALDDKSFRELLSDKGVAVNTATARSYSILAVMDEYRTTPKDLKAPLEEIVEYNSQKGSSFSDTSSAGQSSRSSSSHASSAALAADAHQSSSGSVKGAYSNNASASQSVSGSYAQNAGASYSGQSGSGNLNASSSGHVSGSSNLNASSKGWVDAQASQSSDAHVRAASASASSSSSSSSAYAKANVHAEDHDNVSYKSVVRYQPQSTAPENVNRTYGALVGQLQAYDLRVLDNDMFKSRYFKDAPLTLDKMVSGSELDRYVNFAKTDAKADFFMAGVSVIIDSGVSPTTGQYVCTGLVSAKVYSTVDGEVIASEMVPATGSGQNTDDCAAAVARKMALSIGPEMGAQIQTYWKRRTMYGRELILTLQGQLPLGLRARFANAVTTLPGVSSSVQRSASSTQMEFTVSYKGSAPIDEALAAALAADPAFANLDSRNETDRVLMCLGPCPAAPAAAH